MPLFLVDVEMDDTDGATVEMTQLALTTERCEQRFSIYSCSFEESRWECMLRDGEKTIEASQSVVKRLKVGEKVLAGTSTSPDVAYILAFGPIPRRGVQRITLHRRAGCHRGKNPAIELKCEWQEVDHISEGDFNWYCKTCFPALRKGARLATDCGKDLPSLQQVVGRIYDEAEESPSTESEGESDSSSSKEVEGEVGAPLHASSGYCDCNAV